MIANWFNQPHPTIIYMMISWIIFDFIQDIIREIKRRNDKLDVE